MRGTRRVRFLAGFVMEGMGSFDCGFALLSQSKFLAQDDRAVSSRVGAEIPCGVCDGAGR